MKRQRQQAILRLVQRESLGSQLEIGRRLAELGHAATQSTISRDIEELGLARVRDGQGRLRYVPPEDAARGATHLPLETVLREFVLEVDASRNLAVIKTPPGTAGVVAEALDQAAAPGILGTVAGDNTVLVVAVEGSSGRQVAVRIRNIAGLP